MARLELMDSGGLIGKSGEHLTMVDSSADRRRSDLCNSADRSWRVISLGAVDVLRKLFLNMLRRVRRPGLSAAFSELIEGYKLTASFHAQAIPWYLSRHGPLFWALAAISFA